MSTKAHRLKDLIDTKICDVLHYMTRRLPEQKRTVIRHLASIEVFEHRSGQWIQNGWIAHTENNTGDLIYIDRDGNINKLYKDNRTKLTLMKKTDFWILRCVYCSPTNGVLLVGMYNYDTKTGKVALYKDTGQQIHTIQYDITGLELYGLPRYITENCNGDIIVSLCIDDGTNRGEVVVTERGGRHRFSYTGPPSGSELDPYGICTDALSHILVCDPCTQAVHMIYKDGYFLSLIPTLVIDRPWSLSYDVKTHLLWVGSLNDRICVYRYIDRQTL
ncbi:uncharacterized protein LOC133194325 [Saccostrea echinata]|uniref:uncharacterized protein LOC133194325 n=1 Tax=Saccostrea echinata TaxID=191078 RepID=UPI002A7EFA88|nr:uncharacterized protein LOC133194325 [Saccostrea echinata]